MLNFIIYQALGFEVITQNHLQGEVINSCGQTVFIGSIDGCKNYINRLGA